MIKNAFDRDTTQVMYVAPAYESPLDKKLAEIRKYNEENHTHLSYGKYGAMRHIEHNNQRKQ